jgi:hypothetical protein
MRASSGDRWLLAAIAVPPAILTVASGVVLLAAAFGAEPLWRIDAVTMAEAAARRDGALVVQLIREGHSPNERLLVSPGILAEKAVVVLPLEAAVAADRSEVVEALLTHGAVYPGGPSGLRCLAVQAGADEVVGFLDRRFGTGTATAGCDSMTLPW